MKRNSKFYSLQFGFVYSNGTLYTSKNVHTFLFAYVSDIFSSEVWLKKKIILLENKRLLDFKSKFAKRLT